MRLEAMDRVIEAARNRVVLDATITDKQARMLAAGTFHFTSNRDDADNHSAALGLSEGGLIEIRPIEMEQETVYNCTVTATGRRAYTVRECTKLLFDADAMDKANDDWGANCGPASLAAITGRTLEQIRAAVTGYPQRPFMAITDMKRALDLTGVEWRLSCRTGDWPDFGLARIQWEGPWTKGNFPRAAYPHTHWIAVYRLQLGGEPLIFDANAIALGGWVHRQHWCNGIVRRIIQNHRGADGGWHITHVIEIEPGSVALQP